MTQDENAGLPSRNYGHQGQVRRFRHGIAWMYSLDLYLTCDSHHN